MWSISIRTVRDRWTLFVGAVLSVALGVALVQSSTVLLAAASATRPPVGSTAAQARAVRQGVDDVSSLMGISIMLGLFLTVFIIGSTMAFTVVERRRELALLRLNGASRRQVRRLLVGEGLMVGLVGTGLGFVLGRATTLVEWHLVERVGVRTDLMHRSFPAWVILVDLGAGLGSALLGVLVASRRAGRVRPLDALRQTGEQRRVMTVGRWAWGLLLGIPAVGGAMLARVSGDLLVSILVGLGVIVAGSIALQQLSPLVVPLVARLLGVPARRHVIGELAQAGMRDGVRRSATTAGPVIVLVGLVVGLLGIMATQTEASRVERVHQSSAQLVVVSEGDVTARILATDGVAVASPETDVVLPVRLVRAGRGGARVEAPAVTAVDPAAYRRLTAARPSAGRLADFGAGRAVLGPAAGEDGLGSPGSVQVAGVRLRVVAHLAPTIAGGADVLVDRSDVSPGVLARAPTTTFVRVVPGASVPEVRARLARWGTVASVPAWARRLAQEQARADNGVMLVLAGLGGLYAFLSLVNAVAIGTAQRRRELAVARVVGASRRQVVAAAALESCGVAAIGVLLGGLVVAVCLAGIRHGTAESLGTPVLVVPWTVALGLAGAALVAGAATAAAAAWSATRTPPVRWVAAQE